MFVVAVAIIFFPFKIPEFGFSRVTEVVWERSLHPCQGPKDMLSRISSLSSLLLQLLSFLFCYCVGPSILSLCMTFLVQKCHSKTGWYCWLSFPVEKLCLVTLIQKSFLHLRCVNWDQISYITQTRKFQQEANNKIRREVIGCKLL